MARKQRGVSFDHILKGVYKGTASRFKLEKLAKILNKIVTRKLARIGLQAILQQGVSKLKKEEILGRGFDRLVFAQK